MNPDRIVELLSQSATMIREDLALLAAGRLKLTLFEADVTFDICARLQAILSRIDEVLEAYQRQ